MATVSSSSKLYKFSQKLCYIISSHMHNYVIVKLWQTMASNAAYQHCVRQDEENAGNLKRQLANLFETSLRITVPDEKDIEPMVTACAENFADYQCDNAMTTWTQIKGKGTQYRGPPAVGQLIINPMNNQFIYYTLTSLIPLIKLQPDAHKLYDQNRHLTLETLKTSIRADMYNSTHKS
ncbi:hypothetical protein QQ045_024344 [Rhodiola kirilowii]